MRLQLPFSILLLLLGLILISVCSTIRQLLDYQNSEYPDELSEEIKKALDVQKHRSESETVLSNREVVEPEETRRVLKKREVEPQDDVEFLNDHDIIPRKKLIKDSENVRPEKTKKMTQFGSSATGKYEYRSVRQTEPEKCQTIHIAIACVGTNDTRTAITLFKSLLFHRNSLLHFHLIVDRVAQVVLVTLFETWQVSHLSVSYYSTEEASSFFAWIFNSHYLKIHGIIKLVLPEILPDELHRVIVLEIGTVFAADVAQLWEFFYDFSAQQVLGLVRNRDLSYLAQHSSNDDLQLPRKSHTYNTDVVLMDLAELRKRRWADIWRRVTQRQLPVIQVTALADQDLLDTVLKDFPEMVYHLPCTWNVLLSQNPMGDELYPHRDQQSGSVFKIINWNSALKERAVHRLTRHYNNLYLTFLTHDGNLLRGGILGCPGSEKRKSDVEFTDSCYDFERLTYLKFRTHLYYMDYKYQSNGSDVTLVTQSSLNRLHILEPLSEHWEGPMSITFYVTDPEAQQLSNFIENSKILSRRKNIGYHLVYKYGALYPINYLRNVALDQSITPFVFLTDFDFLPMYNLYEILKKSVIEAGLANQETRALIVPGFETHRYRAFPYPKNKTELLEMMATKDVIPFHSDVWAPGHKATNFSRWINASSWYTVAWEEEFEPYIVVSRNIPRYDTRFGGAGGDRVSHFMTLMIQGYELVVLPNVFTIHMPHTQSVETFKFHGKSKFQYRNCTMAVRKAFIRDLIMVYGANVLNLLQPTTTTKVNQPRSKTQGSTKRKLAEISLHVQPKMRNSASISKTYAQDKLKIIVRNLKTQTGTTIKQKESQKNVNASRRSLKRKA